MNSKQKLNVLKKFLKLISGDFKGVKWIDCSTQPAVAAPYKEAFICNSMCVIAFVSNHLLELQSQIGHVGDEYWLIHYNNCYIGIRPSRVVDWYLEKAKGTYPIYKHKG